MSKAYVPEESTYNFYIPPTLASDFDNFLDHDVPHMVMDFVLLHDWYEQFEPEYEETIIRGELYPDATKSRYQNTDNNQNFRASVTSGIRKGDMVISEDHRIYLLDWGVELEVNNAPSRALRCNMKLTVKRKHPEIVDDRGYLIEEAGEYAVVDALPCNAYRYDGRPEYSAISGTPGVSPNALTLLTIQYNPCTAELKIDDEFKWGNEWYQIVDINRIGVDIEETNGTLVLQAKKKSGGLIQ